jgi:peptide/nickel transport system substrate-binding protein
MAGAGLATAVGIPWLGARSASGRTQDVESIVIDLDGELESIHPSLAYSGRDWSVVNSIYDSIVTIDAGGQVVPLAAETVESDDAQSWTVTLRPDLAFHDGTPVTAEAVRYSWEFLMASGSSAADVFAVIEDVRVDSELGATIVCSSPAPWLPAQIATWMMLVPPGYTDDQALTAPIGTGPYRLDAYSEGQDIGLTRFDGYLLGDVKGDALAESVTFRIVPDAATRVADVATGTAHIAGNIPEDFRSEVEGQGATVLDDPLVGSQWVRIATDTPPFDDPLVRRALNHAIDKATIVEALLGPEVRPLGSILPDERAPGWLESVEPYAFDPDRARELLAEAEVEEGATVQLEMTQSSRKDIAEAIVANLAEVGFSVEIVTSDLATFNAGWTDTGRPALRLVTWSPLYEPHTLLSLVFASEGYLSRYSNGEVDDLIAQAASEADPDARRVLYEALNELMHDDAPVIYLWNITATYAVSGPGEQWQPRGNEQIVPTG